MTNVELDALAKSLGVMTALTGPQRISLLQAAALDRLASAMAESLTLSTREAEQIQQALALAAEALATTRTR